jgi:DNA polymerase III alpha subunit (gram-positive type)
MYICLMRKIIYTLLSLVIANCAICQSMINCKSGQAISIDSEGRVISSNISELAIKESQKPEIQNLMIYLLKNEQTNRVNSYFLNNKISLLEIDLKKEKSDSKKLELKAKQNKLSEIEKEYREIANSISSLRKRDKAVIEKMTAAMIASSERGNLNTEVPNNTSSIESDSTQVETPKFNGEVEYTVSSEKEKNDSAKNASSDQAAVEEGSDENKLQKIKKETKTKKEKKNKKIKDAKENKASRGKRETNNNKETYQNKISIAKVVECNRFVIENKDTYSSQYGILTQYTPVKLENYFKQESFLTISVGIDIKDEMRILKVKCDFVPKDISKSYGAVAMSDFLRIQFINGKRIFLKAVSIKGPNIEQYSGHSIYEFEYKFENGDDITKLKESLLDSIGIMWSTGFEDYQIYEIDFFQNLFNDIETCRKSKLP